MAHKALILDDSNVDAYSLLGGIHWQQGDFSKGLALAQKAVDLDPSYADNVALLASRLVYLNRPDEALALAQKALRLNPYYPGWYLAVVGLAHLLLGEYDEAIAALESSVEYYPESRVIRSELASAYAQAGRLQEAQAVVAKILKLHPKFSAADYAKIEVMPEATLQLLKDGMIKAGLPENSIEK